MDILTRHLQAMADAVDFPYMDRWLEDHIDIPIVATALYLILVHVVSKTFMKNRPAYNLRTLNIVWNLLLSLFSFVGAYYCVPRLYELVTAPAISGLEPSSLRYVANMTPAMRRNIVIPPGFREGVDAVSVRGSLDTSMCVFKDDMYRRNISGLLCLAFMFSKIPEMLDTAFLVFQKKPVIFLHWYHHVTVMLYCWHAFMYNISGGLVFAGMNYGVHSIMYFYYFICSCGYRKYVRPFASFITFLQIAQMVVGMFTEVYTLSILYFTNRRCDSNATNARLGFMMYLSYFILFSKLFYDSYLKPAPPHSAAAKHNDATAVPNGEPAAVKKAQ